MIGRVIAVVLSCLLLAAHFLRGGHLLIVLFCLLVPCFLLVRRRWARLFVQAVLCAGSLLWLQAAYFLAMDRVQAGMPWVRMAVILIGVAIITAGSAVLLSAASVRKIYK